MRPTIARCRSLIRGREAFVRSGLWSLVLRVSGLLSGFAIGVVLARILGPKQFGIYGLVTTGAAIATTITQLGTPQLAVRELSVRAERNDWAGVRGVIYQFGTATLIASLIFGALAIVTVRLLGAPASQQSLVMQGAILVLLTSFTGLFAAELRGLAALLKGQSMDITFRPAVTFIILGGLLVTGFRISALLALVIQNFVTFAAVAISAYWLMRIIPPHGWSVSRTRSIPWAHAALPLGAVDVLRQLDGSYGVILVGWLSTGIDLGVFRVAVACMVLANMPVSIFHNLLAPKLSQLHAADQRDEMQRLLSWTAAAMTSILIPTAIAVWFLGKAVLIFVFGAAYGDAWRPLFLFTLGQLVFGAFGMGPILLAMCEGERDLIRIYSVAVAMAFLAALPMTIAWGGTGAAAAAVISNGLIGIMSWRYGRRELGVEISAVSLMKHLFRANEINS